MNLVLCRRRIATTAAVLFGATVSLILPAGAQTFSSSYSSTAAKDCRTIGKPGDTDGGTTQVCPGKSGLVVLVSEDDLRQTVSVGSTRAAAAKEPAASTSFAPFNSTASTVEWRAADEKPFAIIQRWLIADNDDLSKGGRPDLETCAGCDAPAARSGLSGPPISMVRLIAMPTTWRARRRTNSRVTSNAEPRT